jgi:hypothetical protein
VPFTTVLLAVTVRVDDVPVAGLAENVPVAPAGKPLTDKFTAEAKPPVRPYEKIGAGFQPLSCAVAP